jgi:hypothetical protein
MQVDKIVGYGYLIPYYKNQHFYGNDDFILEIEYSPKIKSFYINCIFKIMRQKCFSFSTIKNKEYMVDKKIYMQGEKIFFRNKERKLQENCLLNPLNVSYLRLFYDIGFLFFKNKEIAILSKLLFFDELKKGNFHLINLTEYSVKSNDIISIDDNNNLEYLKNKYVEYLI